MWEAVAAISGFVAGAVLAWVIATSRARLAAGSKRAELQADLAASKSSASEIREQLTGRETALTSLRQELDSERQERARTETRLQESEKRLEEQQRMLDETEKKLKESFESLSAKALKSNAEQFLQSARKTLEVILADARGDLGKREEAIKTLVKPIAESLKRYETQIQSLEQTRQKAYGSLEEQLKTLTSTSRELQSETGKLVTSLRDPKVRGTWGEMALRRSAELAGIPEHCAFETQVNVTAGDARYRPDMVVYLPGGRTVVIDAKAVLDAYLDAVAATDEETRKRHLDRHARQVRDRIKELSGKSYWDKLEATPAFVVLFLPAESFFSAALESDPKLIEDAISKKVVLASPTTLIALLWAVAYGWRQQQLAENAQEISQLGKELFERMRTLVEHLENIGKGLGRAVDSYNKAVGSLETRVLPSARRFQELGAATGEEIVRLQPIDQAPRLLDTSPNDLP